MQCRNKITLNRWKIEGKTIKTRVLRILTLRGTWFYTLSRSVVKKYQHYILTWCEGGCLWSPQLGLENNLMPDAWSLIDPSALQQPHPLGLFLTPLPFSFLLLPPQCLPTLIRVRQGHSDRMVGDILQYGLYDSRTSSDECCRESAGMLNRRRRHSTAQRSRVYPYLNLIALLFLSTVLPWIIRGGLLCQ